MSAGTQDVWCLLLIYLCFSRFGSIKLGKDDEKPRYNDFVWFSMLFTCGVAVGLYVFGVAEPLYFYHATWTSLGTKIAVQNDAQRANEWLAAYVPARGSAREPGGSAGRKREEDAGNASGSAAAKRRK